MKGQEKELCIMKMGINMRENLITVYKMVTELILGKMVINIREIGLIMKGLEKEIFIMKMGINMRASFIKIHFMVTELFIGKMGIIMRESG
jgi:hypothetical protein